MMVLNRFYKKNLKLVAIVWGISIAVLALFFFFWICPCNSELKQANTEQEKLTDRYNTAVANSEQKKREELTAELDMLRSRVGMYAIETSKSPQVVFDIRELARTSDIAISSVKPSASVEKIVEAKYLRRQQLKIDFQAKFKNFAQFLNSLESHEPVVFVDKFKIVAADDARGLPKVSMDLSIYVLDSDG